MNIMAHHQVINMGLVNALTTQPPTDRAAGFFLRGRVDEGMKLTTHLQLVPRLKTSGATTLFPIPAFTVWAETKLPPANISI
jgi:hypothetical protein